MALLAGVVGLAAGGSLAVAGIRLASTTHLTPSASTQNDQAHPSGHGADVTAAVKRCKAALPAGQHGIGKCVSAVANKHGKSARAAASAKKNTMDAGDKRSVVEALG
ncbi:MAG: hypothetical protein ABI959_05850 [Candidatus Dormiibacterota bacterium]